jgi:hypothetical protein
MIKELISHFYITLSYYMYKEYKILKSFQEMLSTVLDFTMLEIIFFTKLFAIHIFKQL